MAQKRESNGSIEYVLSYSEGKAVQEILHRYVNEELKVDLKCSLFNADEDEVKAILQKDIAYVEELAKYFD